MGRALACELAAKVVARAKVKDAGVWFARVGLLPEGDLLRWMDESIARLTLCFMDAPRHDEAAR
eukprot:4437820-Lingulodinium_polyedra.AAC.1